jgi:diguanylate cyclase (GGDEF)-like protein
LKKGNVFLLLFIALGFIVYFNYKTIVHHIYERYVSQAVVEIGNEIENKKSATLAIAITMSQCQRLRSFLLKEAEPPKCVGELPKIFRRYTHYKNVKIEVLDPKRVVLYRSWSSQKGDVEKIKIFHSYQSDFLLNDLGFFIYSLSSVFNENRELLGYVAVLSHFNSIRKNLEKLGLDMAVVLPSADRYTLLDTHREYSQSLIRKVLASKGFVDTGDEILFYYPLVNIEKKPLGWVLFSAEKSVVLEKFFNRYIFLRIALLFGFVAMALFLLYHFYTKEKERAIEEKTKYFYRILDTLQELVIITDGERLSYANKKFFEYFSDYSSLEEFFKEHECVCDFFVEEEGFLSSVVDGKRWTQYLIENEGKSFKVKMQYKGHLYIFQVKANRIASNEYSVILSDITEEYLQLEELKKMAVRDPLTGVYNRYLFEKIAKEMIEESEIFGTDLLFVMIDIDYFKKINDMYGHDRGDEVLKEVAAIIKRHFRSSDPVIRIGGEEFLIIVQTKSIERIIQILEELKYDIERHKFEGIEEKITVSIGVAKYHSGESVEELYKHADEALYESKAAGRNKITYKG